MTENALVDNENKWALLKVNCNVKSAVIVRLVLPVHYDGELALTKTAVTGLYRMKNKTHADIY